ncbi:MAG: CobQ/CobB/MinD/ParA nucleotide binding domain protein [Candidatus Bathyarchaeota archaeon BA1]|nr:MAG: CobQ/CobB/MinD/ParA nucleotide binding domain protein [Candidatus Bathyarchaeota archaeon BA1]
MKVAITGKGGVGKTFIAATLSRLLARDGYGVLAVDADPAMSLAYALGISADMLSKIVPICENSGLIEERTGAKPGSGFGAIFSLTPTVSDIADRFGVSGPDGVKLLVMGTVRAGGTGCLCPANALLRALIQHIMLERKEAVVMDMEAGLEHLGRATIKGVNAVVVVVEAGSQSMETAQRIRRLSVDIGVGDILAVGNKMRTDEDREFIEGSLEKIGLKPSCMIPFDPSLLQADMLRVAPIDFSPSSPAIEAIRELEVLLKERYA